MSLARRRDGWPRWVRHEAGAAGGDAARLAAGLHAGRRDGAGSVREEGPAGPGWAAERDYLAEDVSDALIRSPLIAWRTAAGAGAARVGKGLGVDALVGKFQRCGPALSRTRPRWMNTGPCHTGAYKAKQASAPEKRSFSGLIDDRGLHGVLEQVRVHKSKVPVQPRRHAEIDTNQFMLRVCPDVAATIAGMVRRCATGRTAKRPCCARCPVRNMVRVDPHRSWRIRVTHSSLSRLVSERRHPLGRNEAWVLARPVMG